MMGKVQAFFRRHQRGLLALLTGLLLVAEAGRLAGQPLVYRVTMALGALVGGLPLLMRALAALRYRVIGIELLVTIAIVGAAVIGEYNEAAIVSWLFILGDQLEAWTLTKTRAAVKALTDLAPQTALVVASPTDPTGELTDIDFVAPGDLVLVKTGTLTLGQPTVVNQWWAPRVPAGVRELLVGVEAVASHPLATAVREAFPEVSGRAVSDSRVVRGQGIVAVADGHLVLVYLAVDGQLTALLGIIDPLRPEAAAMVARLRRQGVSQLVLLSGDQPAVVARVGKALGLDRAEGGLLPEDKVRIMKEYEEGGHSVAFVGDGINDSPSLATATVGVAMGQGTAVAVDVSDLILLRSDLNKLPQARWLAKHLRANMVENIAIALLTVLLLFSGLFAGWVGMASGMLVHELSILVVIVNGMRLLKINPHN